MGEASGEGSGRRLGRWMPERGAMQGWLGELVRAAEARPDGAPLHPAVESFRRLIDADPLVRLLVTQMIDQAPDAEGSTKHLVRDVDHLLRVIDVVIGRAPDYQEGGAVGVPLTAVLDEFMRTPAGFAAFRHPGVNAALRAILRAWCDFLCGPASLAVLNPSPRGWMCESARRSTHIAEFEHDAGAPHWGFASWNDFFTRRFKPGRRPVAEPDDPRVVVNACESTPYAIGTHAKRQDQFWLKAQPYSLHDMLAHPCADQFVGGTVYQAYLDAHNYHRWHSPVAGTVRDAVVRDGTYYSEAEPRGEQASQGYLAHVATRAICFVEADDPGIGLVGLVFVGMGEVSSCVFHPEVRPGRRVRKGEEIGFFQYGGSSYCMVFRPGAVREFVLGAVPDPHTGAAAVLPVNARLATGGP